MNKKSIYKKLHNVLLEMNEISGLEFRLFNADCEQIAGNKLGSNASEELMNEIRRFLKSSVESQIAFEYHFLKISVHNNAEFLLLSNIGEYDSHTLVLAQMAASQVKNLYNENCTPQSGEYYLKQLLKENSSYIPLMSAASGFGIEDKNRYIFVLAFDGPYSDDVKETITNIFIDKGEDYLVEMDDVSSVLFKSNKDLALEDLEQFARMLVDNIQSEAMVNVKVAYSEESASFIDSKRLYEQAVFALKVNHEFNPMENIAIFSRLGIGQLIYGLPADMCRRFLHEVFPEAEYNLMDEEMLMTVEALLDNNLNISETARQLAIHRNTLVYRLERIQKITGLDVKLFSDAMLYKLAMMVKSHLNFIQK